MEPQTIAPTISDEVQIPSSGSIAHILIIYPSLFLMSMILYFLLRTKFPEYFILRIHWLNSKYVITKENDYRFYKEQTIRPKKDNLEELSSLTDENDDITTPLLQRSNEVNSSNSAQQPTRQNPDSIEFNPYQEANFSTITSNYNSLDSSSEDEVRAKEAMIQNLGKLTGSKVLDDGTGMSYEEYMKKNICVRWWISVSNGFKSLFVVLRATDKDLFDLCGLDQLLVLRMIRLMMQLLFGYMIPGLLFLLPLYQLQPQDEICAEYCVDFRMNSTNKENAYTSHCICTLIDQSSLAMVKCAHDSEKKNDFSLDINCLPLWGPVFAMYWCTLLTIWLLRREYKKIIYFRNNIYWLKKKPPQLYTVLVDEIPTQLKLSTRKSIKEHFSTLFPGKVHEVEVVATSGRSNRILNHLRGVGEKREQVLIRLQHLVAKRDQSENEEVSYKYTCKPSSCSVAKVDAIAHYEQKLEELNTQFEAYRRRYLRACERFEEVDGEQVCLSVFITFNSAVTSTIAEQTLIHEQKNIVVIRAPEPSNIHFPQMGYSESNLTLRRYISVFTFIVIILFWGTLTAAVSGITNPESLKQELPSFAKILTKYESIINMVAPLTLIILLSLVNPLIRLLASLHMRVSESEIDELTTFYYFFFLVMQLFLFYGIAGTIFILLQHIVDNPKTLLVTLAETIPKNAAFYISFIVTKIFTMWGLDLLRVSAASVHVIRKLLFGTDITEDDMHKVTFGLPNMRLPTHAYLSSTKAQLLLIYFIATTYITIQPLIAPAAFVFFLISYIICGNDFLNVVLQRYDSGGTSWPHIYVCIMSAIVTSQVTLIGVLIIKEGIEQTVAMWFLLFFTVGASHIVDQRYRKLLQSIPLNVAQRIDNKAGADTEKAVKVVTEPSAIYQYEKLIGIPGHMRHEPKKSVTVYNYRVPVLREAVRVEIDKDH